MRACTANFCIYIHLGWTVCENANAFRLNIWNDPSNSPTCSLMVNQKLLIETGNLNWPPVKEYLK
ncbi:UNVERIFIED_CONTAM: hypothetical protein FKN15_057283 [Acipenser sinensis]